MSLKLLQTYGDPKVQAQLVADTVNKIMSGRANNASEFTLTENDTTTVVTDPAFESSMVPVWSPTTANAAAAMTNLRVTAREKGSFTLTHSNTATLDRTFLYVRWG